MKKEELIKFSSISEADLSIADKLKLSHITKRIPDDTLLLLFNKYPNFLRDYEKVYFAKYLNDYCSFYEKGDDVYVGPKNLSEDKYESFFIPSGSIMKGNNQLYTEEGIKYSDVKIYSIIPGAKYRLNRKLHAGYPSFDKPWEKGVPFTPKKITIPKTPYALLALTDAKLKVMDDAIVCHEAHISRSDMYEKSLALAKSLKQKGIKKGDYVCLSMNEAIEASLVEAACSFIGAISVNLPSNASKEGIKEFLNSFNCKYYFVSDQYRKIAEEATSEMENLEMCVCSSEISFRGLNNLCDETINWLNKCKDERELLSNEVSYDDFVEVGKSYEGKVIEELDIDDPAKVSFTSGTSGKPKPILLSNGNINASFIRMGNYTHMSLGPKGIALKIVSDMYPYGNLTSKWFTMFVGKAVGLTPALTSNNADFYLYFYEPTYILAIPEFVKDLKKYDSIKEKGLKFIKYLTSGGAKYETKEKERDIEFLKSVNCNANILDGAGAGELAGGSTAHNELKYNINSVGKPVVGMEVKIVEDNDLKPISELKELKYNESGLICWGGETLMLEYYGMPEATAESIYTDEYGRRWFVSDAIGHLDEKGSLHITSRKARCFTTFDEETGAAYKISPEEVESVLAESPFNIESVALCMKQENENGDNNNVVKLYIRTLDESELTKEKKEKIIEYLKNSKLAQCSIPKKIVQWPGAWPRINGEGSKIDYKTLQEISDEEENKRINKVMG